jgi:hypothetical protein
VSLGNKWQIVADLKLAWRTSGNNRPPPNQVARSKPREWFLEAESIIFKPDITFFGQVVNVNLIGKDRLRTSWKWVLNEALLNWAARCDGTYPTRNCDEIA